MTVSSGGSWPTNSSPRCNRAPKSRVQARTASRTSSGRSDCGEAGTGGRGSKRIRGPTTPSSRSISSAGLTWSTARMSNTALASARLASTASSRRPSARRASSGPGASFMPLKIPAWTDKLQSPRREIDISLRGRGSPVAVARRVADVTSAQSKKPAQSPGASLRALPPGAFAGFPARFLRHQSAPEASVRTAGMALFHVARYRGTERAGPEAAAAEEGAESRARTLLERLQSRARERQQQRQQEEEQQQQRESEQAAEPAGRRRRRPRRSRGRVSSQASPQEPASKRRKEDGGAADADAGTDGPGTDAVAAARPPDTPAPAPLLGGFRRIKTPKVSGLGMNEPCMVREPTSCTRRPRNAQAPLDPPWQSWAWHSSCPTLVCNSPPLGAGAAVSASLAE